MSFAHPPEGRSTHSTGRGSQYAADSRATLLSRVSGISFRRRLLDRVGATGFRAGERAGARPGAAPASSFRGELAASDLDGCA